MTPGFYEGEEECVQHSQVVRYLVDEYNMTVKDARALTVEYAHVINNGIELRSMVYYIGNQIVETENDRQEARHDRD